MIIKEVLVHKMYENFHQYPVVKYVGVYDNKKQLVKLFNRFNQKLERIKGSYQWCLNDTNDVYFVEEDPIFKSRSSEAS